MHNNHLLLMFVPLFYFKYLVIMHNDDHETKKNDNAVPFYFFMHACYFLFYVHTYMAHFIIIFLLEKKRINLELALAWFSSKPLCLLSTFSTCTTTAADCHE